MWWCSESPVLMCVWTHDSLALWSIHLGIKIRAESSLRIYPEHARLGDSLIWSFFLIFLRDKMCIEADFTCIFIYFDGWKAVGVKTGLPDSPQASCSVFGVEAEAKNSISVSV